MGPESQRIVPAQWLRSSDRYTFPCAGPTDTVEPCQCHIGNIVKHVEATALPSSFKIYFMVAGPVSAAGLGTDDSQWAYSLSFQCQCSWQALRFRCICRVDHYRYVLALSTSRFASDRRLASDRHSCCCLASGKST